MEQLLQFDTRLLLAINSWHTLFLDNFLWNITQKTTWIPLYVSLVVYLALTFRNDNSNTLRSWMRILILVVAVAACAGLSDWICSLIKHAVERPRPTRETALQGVLHIVNGYKGGRFGFVSAHAANTFSVALLFSLIVRNIRTTIPLIVWVMLNCYSRMYLGVHYPADILGGLMVGALLACTVYFVLLKTKVITNHPASQARNFWSDYFVAAVFSISCAFCLL